MPEKTLHAEEANPRLKEARAHVKAAHESFRMSIQELIPKGFNEHRRAARKEILLAMRSLLDAAIEHTEKKKPE
jgi:hypothetical protein